MADIRLIKPSELDLNLDEVDISIDAPENLYAIVKPLHYIDYIERDKYILKVKRIYVEHGRISDMVLINLHNKREKFLSEYGVYQDFIDEEVQLVDDLNNYQLLLVAIGMQIKMINEVKHSSKEEDIEEYAGLRHIHNIENPHVSKDIVKIVSKTRMYDPEGSYYEYRFYNERTGESFSMSTRNENRKYMDIIIFYSRKDYIRYLGFIDAERKKMYRTIMKAEEENKNTILN